MNDSKNFPEPARPQAFRWRAARRTLICLAVLVTLIAAFFTEENWRGKRAWEKCKRELEAGGMDFSWESLIPPAVPDDQNIFKAPNMAGWFVKDAAHPLTNDFLRRLANPKTSSVGAATNEIQTPAEAREYLAWSDQFSPDFDLMREALRRPYARMEGDYARPATIPIPNYLTMRSVDQTLAQRARCHLLLGEPDQALHELTLFHDLGRVLEGAPTGKPMTLVSAMINVAVTGLYASTVADGLRMNAWREPQLVAIEKQLGEINLMPILETSFRCERISSARTLETTSRAELSKLFDGFDQATRRSHPAMFRLIKYAPQGWFYQNMIAHAHLGRPFIDALDTTNRTVSPSNLDESTHAIQTAADRAFRYNFLTALAMPNFVRAIQTFARNQTSANQAAVACALERYHLVRGQYPEALNALTPQFIEKLPRDLIGGQPLKYRRTDDGKFLLYSIGWNEKDEGGAPGKSTEEGDWVWQGSLKP